MVGPGERPGAPLGHPSVVGYPSGGCGEQSGGARAGRGRQCHDGGGRGGEDDRGVVSAPRAAVAGGSLLSPPFPSGGHAAAAPRAFLHLLSAKRSRRRESSRFRCATPRDDGRRSRSEGARERNSSDHREPRARNSLVNGESRPLPLLRRCDSCASGNRPRPARRVYRRGVSLESSVYRNVLIRQVPSRNTRPVRSPAGQQ
ncbi:hypothetical protein PUN28_014982 [Cardiocondyla obscurior]|uniref:Uncharacterized protein n=1 Tax=Cardiocondyla obscurior TaxID=286306 RepID=A0AAW2EWB4_9HYME